MASRPSLFTSLLQSSPMVSSLFSFGWSVFSFCCLLFYPLFGPFLLGHLDSLLFSLLVAFFLEETSSVFSSLCQSSLSIRLPIWFPLLVGQSFLLIRLLFCLVSLLLLFSSIIAIFYGQSSLLFGQSPCLVPFF